MSYVGFQALNGVDALGRFALCAILSASVRMKENHIIKFSLYYMTD